MDINKLSKELLELSNKLENATNGCGADGLILPDMVAVKAVIQQLYDLSCELSPLDEGTQDKPQQDAAANQEPVSGWVLHDKDEFHKQKLKKATRFEGDQRIEYTYKPQMQGEIFDFFYCYDAEYDYWHVYRHRNIELGMDHPSFSVKPEALNRMFPNIDNIGLKLRKSQYV